jgi:hypothetical protein
LTKGEETAIDSRRRKMEKDISEDMGDFLIAFKKEEIKKHEDMIVKKRKILTTLNERLGAIKTAKKTLKDKREAEKVL